MSILVLVPQCERLFHQSAGLQVYIFEHFVRISFYKIMKHFFLLVFNYVVNIDIYESSLC
jgi:hypothetical protein